MRLSTTLLFGLLASPAFAQTSPACPPVPSLMQAAVAPRAGGPEVLELRYTTTPRPGPGDLLVRVHFAGINPVDWKWQERGVLPANAIPGGDFSGVVAGLGQGSTGFSCGDAVAGIADPQGTGGSYAQYVVVPAESVVRKPAMFALDEAAAYPTATIAAWRYLIAAAGLQPGERVLVHGGAGGVGSMVVQMAKAQGAWVAATSSAEKHDYLRSLGADQVIDYRRVRFEDVVDGIDVVVDTVGGETLARSPAVLRRGGRLVTLVGSVPAELCAGGRIACPAAPAWNTKAGLDNAAPLIEAGKLRPSIERAYPLAQAADAQRHSRSGRTRGKLVLAMPTDDEAGVMVPLQAYLDGHATGQEAHFLRAFAEDAWLHGIKDGLLRRWPAADYVKASASGRAPSDENLRRRAIRQVTVTGDVATAVIELDYPDMKALDHMTLLRRDGEWRIVLKAYEAVTPPPAAAAP